MGHVVELNICEECGEPCEPGERYCRRHKSLENVDNKGSFMDEATKKDDEDMM